MGRAATILAVAAAAAAGLAACGTGKSSADYQAYIQQWAGKPAAQLTADWGPPDYSYSRDGLDVLQYRYAQAVSFGERPVYLTCNTNFLANPAGTVVRAETEGDACFGQSLRGGAGPAARVQEDRSSYKPR